MSWEAVKNFARRVLVNAPAKGSTRDHDPAWYGIRNPLALTSDTRMLEDKYGSDGKGTQDAVMAVERGVGDIKKYGDNEVLSFYFPGQDVRAIAAINSPYAHGPRYPICLPTFSEVMSSGNYEEAPFCADEVVRSIPLGLSVDQPFDVRAGLLLPNPSDLRPLLVVSSDFENARHLLADLELGILSQSGACQGFEAGVIEAVLGYPMIGKGVIDSGNVKWVPYDHEQFGQWLDFELDEATRRLNGSEWEGDGAIRNVVVLHDLAAMVRDANGRDRIGNDWGVTGGQVAALARLSSFRDVGMHMLATLSTQAYVEMMNTDTGRDIFKLFRTVMANPGEITLPSGISNPGGRLAQLTPQQVMDVGTGQVYWIISSRGRGSIIKE